MRAAWYERQGAAADVLTVGVMADPTPGPGEVRIRIVASGINPGDIKKRQNAFGYGMPYPRARARVRGEPIRVSAVAQPQNTNRRASCTIRGEPFGITVPNASLI